MKTIGTVINQLQINQQVNFEELAVETPVERFLVQISVILQYVYSMVRRLTCNAGEGVVCGRGGDLVGTFGILLALAQ